MPVADLPRLEVALDLTFELVGPIPTPSSPLSEGVAGSGRVPAAGGTQLVWWKRFDQLLGRPSRQGVEAHWYQIETVRKVLKQYRGRVLLADEVGLGKTVEAGMVLKEYMLRGMAERVLILVPAPLVGQWHDEMAAKFGIDCATTHDGERFCAAIPLRSGRSRWRVIASIATARRREHADVPGAARLLLLVVVDEAHHLRDQASASYKLVNTLQKRFLLLLSATPVQ